MKSVIGHTTAAALAASMLLTPGAPARAATVTDLAYFCASAAEPVFPAGLCLGYITGVFDLLTEVQVTSKVQRFCVPETATAKQITDEVISFVNENLDRPDLPAHIAVEYALRVRFPCKN